MPGGNEVVRATGAANDALEVRLASALRYVNKRRALIGQRELDPVTAGWTAEDVLVEAKRLGWQP